jgi:hypothetical protein
MFDRRFRLRPRALLITEARFQVRQGDVLLVRVDAIPPGARARRRNGRIVLATGETTGHAHAIAELDASEFRVGGERYVLVRSRAQLIHEEHAPIHLGPGAYRVVVQREFDPAAAHPGPGTRAGHQPWRRVAD